MGRTPKLALRMSLRTSWQAFTALDGDRPVAMLGVCPRNLAGGTAAPWFLGTDEVLHFGRDLLERGRRIIGMWLDEFPLLENAVSIENQPAVRLLQAWGATLDDEPLPYGGIEFRRFSFRRGAIQGNAAAA